MARISFANVASLPDTLDVIAYEMIFGTIPGSGDSRGLTLRSKDSNIPGFSNESFSSTLHGHTRNFRGRAIWPGTWSTNFVETVDGYMWNTVKAWHERVVGSESGNSTGYLRDYSVAAQLIVYDTAGAVVSRHILEDVFPQDVGDVQVSGEASAAMSVAVTWKYARARFGTLL